MCDSKTKKPSLKKTKLKVYTPPTVSFQGQSLLTHTAVYMGALGYDVNDTYFPSEIDGSDAVDLHHLINRSKCKEGADHILNLMALTREQHEEYGDKKEHYFSLIQTHLNFLISKDINIFVLSESLPHCLGYIREVMIELYGDMPDNNMSIQKLPASF